MRHDIANGAGEEVDNFKVKAPVEPPIRNNALLDLLITYFTELVANVL